MSTDKNEALKSIIHSHRLTESEKEWQLVKFITNLRKHDEEELIKIIQNNIGDNLIPTNLIKDYYVK